jgi:hypothetical protein
MARSKKSKASSRMEALAEALNALNPPTLEVVIRLPGSLPQSTRLERRLINAVLDSDKVTVIKVYRGELVRDDPFRWRRQAGFERLTTRLREDLSRPVRSSDRQMNPDRSAIGFWLSSHRT